MLLPGRAGCLVTLPYKLGQVRKPDWNTLRAADAVSVVEIECDGF
jgi:hypothetical protein